MDSKHHLARKLRLQAQLSAKEVAARSGVSYSLLMKIENKYAPLTDAAAACLAPVLGVTMDVLLGNLEPPPDAPHTCEADGRISGPSGIVSAMRVAATIPGLLASEGDVLEVVPSSKLGEVPCLAVISWPDGERALCLVRSSDHGFTLRRVGEKDTILWDDESRRVAGLLARLQRNYLDTH